MLRYALTAVFALSTVPALADNRDETAHTHGSKISGSKSVPFNHRPHDQVFIVRSQAYDASARKDSGRNHAKKVGRSQNPTGDAVTEIFVGNN